MSSLSAPPAFAELVAATNYSFLRGASHPAEMVAEAIALGMSGIGIADRNSVAGVVRAWAFVKELQVKSPAMVEVSGLSSVRVSPLPTAPPISSPIPSAGMAGDG